MMFLSAGAETDQYGNTNNLLGIGGLAEVNPKTGSFDLSIPTGEGGIINLGYNTKTKDAELGIGAGIKKWFEISVGGLFNFHENAEKSKEMRQQANNNFESTIRMEDGK